VLAPGEEAGVEEPGDVGSGDRSVAHPAGGGLHLHQGLSQYSPREPLRTTSTGCPRVTASVATAIATASAPTERAPESRGT
jgi:hypothetical protein